MTKKHLFSYLYSLTRVFKRRTKPSVMRITLKPHDGGAQIEWSYKLAILKMKDGNTICCVPGFEFYYCAKDAESMKIKGNAFMQSYFDGFFKHGNKRMAISQLTIDLRRRGFMADHYHTKMHKLIRNKAVKTDFKREQFDVPDNYEMNEDVIEKELAF